MIDASCTNDVLKFTRYEFEVTTSHVGSDWSLCATHRSCDSVCLSEVAACRPATLELENPGGTLDRRFGVSRSIGWLSLDHGAWSRLSSVAGARTAPRRCFWAGRLQAITFGEYRFYKRKGWWTNLRQKREKEDEKIEKFHCALFACV